MASNDLRSRVLDRISNNDWLSENRRRYLERLGTLTAGSKIRVSFQPIPTASCGWNESGRYHQINMRNSVVPTHYLGEIESKLGSDLIHTLMQEGFLYHELGHVLMSDYDVWSDAVDRSGSLKKNAMYKQWLNCTEDVVIEAWLREKYNCGKILDFKNEIKLYSLCGIPRTKAGAQDFYSANLGTDSRGDPDFNEFSFVLSLIESLGRFDGHFIEWAENHHSDLMDTYRGPVTKMISDAVREPNATARYELILDTMDDLFQNFSDADQDPNQSKDNEMAGGQQMQVEMIPVPEGSGSDDGDDEDEEQGDGEGQQPSREAREIDEILKGRSPEEVKVLM